MKVNRNAIAAALIAVSTLGAGTPAMAAESHQHGAAEMSKLTLNHGMKWATDEPLRRNMAKIRTAVAARHEGIHKGTLTAEEYKALGAAVESAVASIVAECKLEPAADANLHLIVAKLIAGADALQGKSSLAPAKGAVEIVRAANEYGRYFNHPGWKPLA
jgi:hypothetical protein